MPLIFPTASRSPDAMQGMDLQGPLVQREREGWNKDMAQLSSRNLGHGGGDTLFLLCPFLRVTGLCVHHSTTAGGFRRHRRLLPRAFLIPYKGPMESILCWNLYTGHSIPGQIRTLKAFPSPLVQRISISPMTAERLDPQVSLHSLSLREAVKFVF